MPTLPTSVLPMRIPHGPKPSSAIQVSPLLLEAAESEVEAVLQKLHTTKGGLSAAEAEGR
jgi:P-type Mg2+ transporter